MIVAELMTPAPSRLRRGALLAVASSALTLAVSGPAGAADEKLACIASAEAAQQLRRHGQLVEAMAELDTCRRDVCPTIVRVDCARWAAEVDAALPTVVVRAQSALGSQNALGPSLPPVKVTVDGVARDGWDGVSPLALDAGAHDLVFGAEGFEPVRQHVSVEASDRNRPLRVVFVPPRAAAGAPTTPGAPAVDSGAASSASPLGAPPPSAARRPIPTATWVFGGVALAAGASFAAFGLWGSSEASDLRASCAPRCADSSLAAPRTKFLVADASLAIAAVAVAGAAVTWVLRPHPTDRAAGPAAAVAVAPLPGGAVARLVSTF